MTDLDTWLVEPEEPRPQLQSVLFTKVVLAILSGRPTERFLDAQRARHLEAMRTRTAFRRAAQSTQDAPLADYQPFHIEADLGWIDHAEGRLAALAGEVRDASGSARP